MIMPSISWCGSPSISKRSLNVPGSISSALATRYLGRGASSPIGTKLHFMPVGNRLRRGRAGRTSSLPPDTASGVIVQSLAQPW